MESGMNTLYVREMEGKMVWLGDNVERWNVKWISLVMCWRRKLMWIGLDVRWETEVKVNWLVDTLKDGRFNQLAWISVERWQVK
jgi:hypothetical protein